LTILAQFKEIIACFAVAIFKTIMKYISSGSFYNMGEETEIVAKGEKCILMHSDFPIAIQIRQYSPVLSQQPVNIPDEIVGVTV
jgi:hypothetical protein